METKLYTGEEAAIFECIARIVSSVRGVKSDYTCLASELEQAVPFDIFGVVLLQYDHQAVRITICEREGGGWRAENHRHPFLDSKMQQMSHCRTLLVKEYPDGLDGSPAECGDVLSHFHQLHSTLIVPLMVGDHLLGTLELGSTVPHTYADEALQRLMIAIAELLATAIESIQLGGNRAIQDRQREALKDVMKALTEKVDLVTILNRIVVGISEALNVSSCILLRDDRQSYLCVNAQSGLQQSALEEIFGVGLPISEKCIFGQTVLYRKQMSCNDLAEDERFPESRRFVSELGLHSILTRPLAIDTTVYGVLWICSSETGGFAPLKTDIFALFAKQATIAIHNGILLESVYQRSRFQQAIEQLEQVHRRVQEERGQPDAEDELALLAQTAESALTRVDIVGQLGHLLQQLKQSAIGVKDAWFIVNLDGICEYMNPAAESFCEMHLMATSYAKQSVIRSLSKGQMQALKIEDVFEQLFPRIHNGEEFCHYLQDFTQSNTQSNDLHCSFVLMRAPLDRVIAEERSLPRESFSTDSHYQCIRYPLYDEQGRLAANALQVQDITQQVCDERNRSALLSSVSHELRTPLTTIKAAVTGLLQPGVAWSEEDRQDMLQDINHEADQLALLINGLVELSRIQMGALILEKEWCDILEVFYGALAKVESMWKGRTVQPKIVMPLPLVYADHVQLEHVFYHLMENAVRRSPPETPIEVVIELKEEGSKLICVQIIDRGERILEQECEGIFKTFACLRSPSSRSGMGLAICRGIIEAHKGKIKLDTTVMEGTCFVFTLPLHPQVGFINRRRSMVEVRSG